MHQQNNGRQLVVDIGEIIDYQGYDGGLYEGEILEISTERNQIKVQRFDNSVIIEPIEWISVENIFLRDDEDAVN